MSDRAPGVCGVLSPEPPKPHTPPGVQVARIAAGQHGVISTAQLASCGLSGQAITLRSRNGQLHRVHRGVYAVGSIPLTLEARFMAAVLAGGERAVLSHFAAAALWGLLAWEERHPEVTVVGWATGRRQGLRVHRARRLDARDVKRKDAIRVTSPARTLLDLAGAITPVALRRAIRQALGDRLVTVAQLAGVLTRANGHRGAGALAAVITDCLVPTSSALEDALLDLLADAGLPAPEVNRPLALDGRTVVADLRWPERRLVVEADGAAWHDNPIARADDAERQALLEAHGERVVRVTWHQILGQPQQTLDRIRAALTPD